MGNEEKNGQGHKPVKRLQERQSRNWKSICDALPGWKADFIVDVLIAMYLTPGNVYSTLIPQVSYMRPHNILRGCSLPVMIWFLFGGFFHVLFDTYSFYDAFSPTRIDLLNVSSFKVVTLSEPPLKILSKKHSFNGISSHQKKTLF